MRITPQASLPSGGPDSIMTGSPPGALLLGSTNGVSITLSMTAGAATVAPYWWDGAKWCPLYGDVVKTVSLVSADVASVPVASLWFYRPQEPRWFALLKAGAGTVDYADISEAVLSS